MSARPIPVRRSVRARPHLRWVPSPRFIDVQLKPKDPLLRAAVEEAIREDPYVEGLTSPQVPDLIILANPDADPDSTIKTLAHETLHNELNRFHRVASDALDDNANNVVVDRTGLGVGMGRDRAKFYTRLQRQRRRRGSSR